jgi:pimeloyl-ACP methyl ester carboxylesterase
LAERFDRRPPTKIDEGAVDVGGVRVAYRRAGEGVPIVLLHGGPTDSREWSHQLGPLSAEHTVVAWDMPGCGLSSDPPPEWRDPRDYADCLAGFIRALGLDRPHLAGLSFGTGLAIELYRRYPELPRSLILASAYAGWAGSLSPEAVEQRKQMILRQIDSPPGAWAQQWLPTLFGDLAGPETVALMREILEEFHPEGQRALIRAGFAEHDVRDVLPTIQVPTLLIYGEKDGRSPLAVAAQMHAAIPGSRLVVIPGAGHECGLEAPDRFNQEVLGYLRSIRAQAVRDGFSAGVAAWSRPPDLAANVLVGAAVQRHDPIAEERRETGPRDVRQQQDRRGPADGPRQHGQRGDGDAESGAVSGRQLG